MKNRQQRKYDRDHIRILKSISRNRRFRKSKSKIER